MGDKMTDTDEYGLTDEQKRDWRFLDRIPDNEPIRNVADALVTVLAELMKRNAQLTTYKTWSGELPSWVSKQEADWRKAAEDWLRE